MIAKNGVPVYERAFGTANRQSHSAMQLDTRLQTASATKLFTNIAIRQLEQAGRLRFSDTVGRFLPNYPNPVVRSQVTVEQLLTHRSGVGSFWNAKYMQTASTVRTTNDYMSLFQDDSLLFPPGTKQTYSNGGFVLLGAIIEKVSGQSYSDYVHDHIFLPAGMVSTVPFDNRIARPNIAIGYTTQSLGGSPSGDSRLAGGGPRPGMGGAAGAPTAPPPGMQLMLIGPDGKQLSPEQVRAAQAERAAPGAVRQPNSPMMPGFSSPAGDYLSTAGDLVRLGAALSSHRLLDSLHTQALLGPQFTTGADFRANGGAPGVNAEFSMFANGYTMVVLSNYDPPSATTIAQSIRPLLAGR